MGIAAGPDPARDESRAHAIRVLVGSALAYGLAAWIGDHFEVGPGYASPIDPSAGIALACALVWGARVVPALAFGSFAADFASVAARGLPTGQAALVAALFAIGTAAQTLVGAHLVRRLLPGPLTLEEPREVVIFYVAAALSCLASAIVAALVLDVGALLPAGTLPITTATWLIGDLLGVVVVTPLVLTFVGRPREAWAPRRRPVGLTLVLAAAVLVAGVGQTVRWNAERTQATFERDAMGAAGALTAKLQEPLYALEALRAVLSLARDPSRNEVQVATRGWLEAGGVKAMGWGERVPVAELPAWEARNRADGAAGYRVFDREDGGGSDTAPADGPREVMAVRYIEPLAANAGALGVNALSIAPARRAIDAARRTGRPSATHGFRLTQDGPASTQPGVVIYQAVYAGEPQTPLERLAATRGVAFVSLAMDAPLQSVAPQLARYLRVCIVENDEGRGARRLAGPPGCEKEEAALSHVQPLAYAGRQWDLRVYARAADLPSAFNGNTLLLALMGVAATGLLGAFLLTMTGRTRRIELAVRQRTAALEAEVGEREIAEAALRDSEQRFRNILDNVPIGVIYTNVAGDVIQANPRFCELTGYTEDELLTLSLFDCTHPEDVPQERELLEQLVRGEIPMYRRNKRYLRKDGGTVWVRTTVSVLRDAQNQPWRIVGVVEDITEHLRLEEAEHARERAEASNRAKSDFLSRMSHELRTPLNAMLGFAQLLELDQRHPLTAAQKPWVVQIQQAGWHLLEMINDVLDLSRIESGTLRLQAGTLDLTEILDATLAMVASDARARGIAISQELASGTSALFGDGTRVKQILTNLLSNAVKYNRDGGRIHVASRIVDLASVEIAVTDTGLGMTPRQMAELFQPFNRLGRERTTAQGTGIGLVISQRLAELMGGSLKATSVAGQGSSFLLVLPRAIDPDTIPSDLDPLTSEPAEYHRRVVHYVEDNETNVEVMRGIVAQRPQVQMEVSVTGLDGLAAMRSRRPDLILLDMNLPDISGLELLRHLKGDVQTAGIPIVVVSADALSQQISVALECGAERYLTKPVAVGEVLSVLDDLLERMDTAFS